MRLSKYEQNMLRDQKRKAALSGSGLFIFRNNTSGELMLPRPTKSGKTRLAPKEEFQGDDYYMFMVRNNELRLVRQLEPPTGVVQAVKVTEQVMAEHHTAADHIIVEQPPTVTTEGTEEVNVVDPTKQPKKLNEGQPKEHQSQQGDILLNDNPLDGIEIV